VKSRTALGITLLAALALSACAGSGGSYFAPTAAVVCTRISCNKIPDSMIAERLQTVVRDPQAATQFRGPQGAANRLQAQREILSSLILDEVALQQARLMGLRPSDAEVNELLGLLEREYGGEKGFKEALERDGYTLGEIRKYLGEQAVLNKVVETVSKDARPTDQQVAQFYDLNKSQFDSQVRAQHILICANFEPETSKCTPGPGDQAQATQLAERARRGEDFGALAREFSKDNTTKDKGGDIGFFSRGDLERLPELEEAAFNLLLPGEVSNPVKTSLGLHVVKLTAIGKPFEEAKAGITDSLRRQQVTRAYQTWLVEAIKNARVKVNPKLGRFDKISQKVVPARAPTRVAAPPATPAP
jgi:foldase protein PrsA